MVGGIQDSKEIKFLTTVSSLLYDYLFCRSSISCSSRNLFLLSGGVVTSSILVAEGDISVIILGLDILSSVSPSLLSLKKQKN